MVRNISLFVVALSVTILLVNGCDFDSDCKFAECCRNLVAKVPLKRCQPLGGPEDRCGGETRCGCAVGYECVEDVKNFLNTFKWGNGTCQVSLQMQQETQRRVFIDV